jgi:hypothetical protein
MTNVSMTDSQQVLVTVAGGIDKKGNPAPLDGNPTFTSADPTIVEVQPDPAGNPSAALLVAKGPLTSATIVTVTADAKIGPDVENITDNISVEITAGQATSFAITVGTPAEQP